MNCSSPEGPFQPPTVGRLARDLARRLLVLGLASVSLACADATALEPQRLNVDPPPPEPPPQLPQSEWNRVLADTTVLGDVVVPDGERWLIGPGVQIQGNLRTFGGTVGLRPGSTLKFLGADPALYVGGGMGYEDRFAKDIGLWIGRDGTLDVSCTPKESWNRTGTHPTWRPDDEYWIAPTDAGAREPRLWHPGEPIPRVDPRVPPAEVMNITRDCVIEGPGHIHISSSKPQRIEYVQLRGLGVIQPGRLNNSNDPEPALTGRYALHLHMMGDGARGTIIQGVAAIDSRGRVFVPHTSHGVTMIDNVSVNSWAEALWWDRGHATNDVLIDRLAACGATVSREISGQAPRFSGIHLMWGTRMEIRNSVACGVRGNKLSVGFGWETGTGNFEAGLSPVWEFSAGNVAHNNSGPGVRFWNNSREPHVVSNFISYHNGAGIENGAYKNSNRYADILSLNDGTAVIYHTSSTKLRTDGGPGRYERCHLQSRSGPAFSVDDDSRNLPSEPGSYVEIIDCTLIPGSGQPKVYVGRGNNPWFARFVRSGVTPDDISFDLTAPGNNGSHVFIDHEDGRRWEIRVRDNQKIVTPR